MAEVQFDEPGYTQTTRQAPRTASLLTKTVIASGLAKSEAGAQRVLLGIAVLLMVAAAGVFLHSQTSHIQQPPANVFAGMK